MVAKTKQPARAARAIWGRLLARVPHRRYRRFVILARSRTGSNLLVTFLNSHPNIRSDWEIFAHLEGRNYADVLGEIWSSQPRTVKARGFKLFYYHPKDEACPQLWEALAAMPDLHVIHLKRRNILHTMVSLEIARMEGVWAIKTAQQEAVAERHATSVSFTREELEKGFHKTRAWERAGENLFRNQAMITVYYEDLVSDHDHEFRRLTNFLGVPYRAPRTRLRKQNRRDMRQVVSNHDELKAAFTGTQWAEFFDDDAS